MLYLLLHWIVSALALMGTAYLVGGFKISGFASALLAALFVGFINAIIWRGVLLMATPVHPLGLAILSFFVSAVALRFSAAVLPGFQVTSWSAAILGAIVLSVIGAALHFRLV